MCAMSISKIVELPQESRHVGVLYFLPLAAPALLGHLLEYLCIGCLPPVANR